MKLRWDDQYVSEQTTLMLAQLQEMLHPASQRTKYGRGLEPQQEKRHYSKEIILVCKLNFKSKSCEKIQNAVNKVNESKRQNFVFFFVDVSKDY